MKKIILWALCCMVFNLTQAQQNYEKAYKKARTFTKTNADSAMVWAEKCLDLAETKGQHYGAHYLRAFNAYKIGMHGQALYDYTQAQSFTTDSAIYFRVHNNLADTYLRAGKLAKAIKLNQQSIDYNKQNKKWANLSYAYEVRSAILLKQRNEKALSVLHKTLQFRQKYVPKQVGHVYPDMAEAFASFEKPDSAIKYQRLALKHYPIRTSDKIAILHTQLAKYLIQNNQAKEALAHLRKAQVLKKTVMTKFFWNHALGLYFRGINAHVEAHRMFDRCEVLYKNMLAKAQDIVTRRTINECGKELYEDFRQLKDLNVVEHKLYGARLKTIKTSLASDEREIERRDSIASQQRQIRELKKAKADSLAKSAVETNTPKPKQQDTPQIKGAEAKHYSTLYWLLGLGMAAGLAIWAGLRGFKIYRTTKINVTSEEYNDMIEGKFIRTLTKKFGAKLSDKDEAIVKEYFWGKSYDQLVIDKGKRYLSIALQYFREKQ